MEDLLNKASADAAGAATPNPSTKKKYQRLSTFDLVHSVDRQFLVQTTRGLSQFLIASDDQRPLHKMLIVR